jgi:hypothetical protein
MPPKHFLKPSNVFVRCLGVYYTRAQSLLLKTKPQSFWSKRFNASARTADDADLGCMGVHSMRTVRYNDGRMSGGMRGGRRA